MTHGGVGPHGPWPRAGGREHFDGGSPIRYVRELGVDDDVGPDLPEDRDITCDHGAAARERFDDGQAKALGLAWHHDHGGVPVEARKALSIEAGELDQAVTHSQP